MLDHFFEQTSEYFSEEKGLTLRFVNASCNHISVSQFLNGYGTLLDLMDNFFPDNLKPNTEIQQKLQGFIEKWGLERKSEIARERL